MYPGSKNPAASYSIRLKTLALTNLIILTFLLSSCSDDNPVKPTPPSADTSRYTWDTTLAWNHMLWVNYAADTNDVYFVDAFYKAIYYHNRTFKTMDLNDPNFSAEIISGIDKNNIFVGGGSNSNVPSFKIIKNSQVSTFEISDYTGYSVCDLLVVGIDQCWLSTLMNNKIFHFVNGYFTDYSLDSGSVIGKFYKDNSGQMFVFARKFLGNSVEELIYYKFIYDGFQKIGSDTIDNNNDMSTMISTCGNDALRMGHSSIYYFDGNSWIKRCNTINSFSPFSISGKSRDDFVCVQGSFPLPNLYSFKNNLWVKEWGPIPNDCAGISSIFVSNDNIYATSFNFQGPIITLFLNGKLK